MRHKSVLLQEVISNLNLTDNATYLDLTLGSAGHAQAVCTLGYKNLTIIGVDADAQAIERSAKNLEGCHANIILEKANYRNFPDVLSKHNIKDVNAIVIDLGISSEQLDIARRGFSFRFDEPLVMTLNDEPTENELTAKIILNEFSEEALANVIYAYGEERFARRIAHRIVEERQKHPLELTSQLEAIVRSAIPKRLQSKKINPATKTFQAIRIAVNNELETAREAILKAPKYLRTGGRLAVISFHSLEDRIVKQTFRELKERGEGTICTSRPIVPSEQELLENPRARSAKLRIFEKI
jgi:16S rRNA (cytosine1402-N4)-methyltransferase